MCGLCGIAFADDRPAESREIEAMTATLAHRGPDAQRSYVTNGAALGFRRLAIIDLESGDQPIQNEDRTVTLVCNGEIYNYVELREGLQKRGHMFRTHSDVETIVHLYEDYGPACVEHLRGMFAFAIWDARQKRLMLARDRFGMKPMHYAVGPHRIDFASEQKAILAGGAAIHRGPDPEAIRDLLEFGFVMHDRTLVRGIRRLLPGHYLIYRRGELSIHQYWDVSFSGEANGSDPKNSREWAEALHSKLQQSVRLHMRSDVPVGSLLSPGLDSSAVTALASQSNNGIVHTVTLGFDDPSLDETRLFPTLNRYPGFPLENEVVRCTDEDFGRFPEALAHSEEPTDAMIPRMILCQAAARRVKVVLTGEGSDEIFGGYAWYRHDKVLRPFAQLPLWMRRILLRARPQFARWNERMTRLFLAPPQMGMIRYGAMIGSGTDWRETGVLVPCIREEMLPEPERTFLQFPSEFARWNAFQQLQYLDLKVRLPELINHSLDRMSMAWGLEARLPFLDHELVDFTTRTPTALKLRGFEEKYILRRAMRGTLPPEILKRRKYGMGVPTLRWWRGKLPEFAADAMSDCGLRRRGIFDPAAVRRILELHRSGQGRYAWFLNAVLAVQLRFPLNAV